MKSPHTVRQWLYEPLLAYAPPDIEDDVTPLRRAELELSNRRAWLRKIESQMTPAAAEYVHHISNREIMMVLGVDWAQAVAVKDIARKVWEYAKTEVK